MEEYKNELEHPTIIKAKIQDLKIKRDYLSLNSYRGDKYEELARVNLRIENLERKLSSIGTSQLVENEETFIKVAPDNLKKELELFKNNFEFLSSMLHSKIDVPLRLEQRINDFIHTIEE